MLDLIPKKFFVYVLVASVLFSVVSVLQANHARTELANLKAEMAIATQKSDREERTKEQFRQTQANRVANDDLLRQNLRQASAHSLDAATDGLRDAIANARPASEGANPAASAQTATTAIELLGYCANEYSELAKVTDKLSDQVTGLQDFVETATGVSESE